LCSGQDGDGDARGGGQADCRLAPARLRTWLRRHRTGLGDPGPDRLFRTLWLHRDRTVFNLAARLCAEAKDGQILVSSRIAGAVEAIVKLEDLGNLELKGLRRPVAVFNVTELISGASARA
jgi:hypothetical protein